MPLSIQLHFRKKLLHTSTHLLNEVNRGLEVEAKVDESPLNAFCLVLLLLQNEHSVVEELLQLLIGVVDAQLLEGVELLDDRERQESSKSRFVQSKRNILQRSQNQRCPGCQ